MPGFDSLVPLLKPLDPVAAGGVNLPFRTLDQNVRYLYSLLQAAGTGATIYARRQTVESACVNGMPVWYNPATKQFERGLASTSIDNATGLVGTLPSSQVWGVVNNKSGPTLADVLLMGYDTVDISGAVDGPVTPGTYYLSGAKPGFLVLEKPPATVPVLRATGAGQVLVLPQYVDFFDRHVHYRFPLTCLPAGIHVPPAVGDTHEIIDANPLLPGWLPAGDSSFNGLAPTGALFGYNLAMQPGLKSLWPPVPLTGTWLDWDRGLDLQEGPQGVPAGLCLCDQNGIWWMSNCYGDVPWPTDLDTSGSASASASASAAACPRDLAMSLILWFSRTTFDTQSAVVLSVLGDERIKVTCATDPATQAATGNLQLSLDLNLTTLVNQFGYLALKTFDPATSTFTSGPVVEGVYALSDNVLLSGSVVGPRTINGVTYQVTQGLVGLSVVPESALELDVQLVRLDGAEEAFLTDPPITYLGFDPGEDETYRAVLQVPSTLAIPTPHLQLQLTLLGLSAGDLPTLTVTARRVPQALTPAVVPDATAEFAVTIDTTLTTTAPNQYAMVTSEAFVVAPGDLVYFSVSRSSADAYGDVVGVMRQTGLITSGG